MHCCFSLFEFAGKEEEEEVVPFLRYDTHEATGGQRRDGRSGDGDEEEGKQEDEKEIGFLFSPSVSPLV